MWDFLKKVGGAIVERGADYLVQNAAFQEILNAPSVEVGLQRVQAHVASLETPTSFDVFMVVLKQNQQQAWQALEYARENPSGSSWGNTFEDRLAQGMAELQAGINSHNSPHVQQAEQLVQALQQAEFVAQQTWAAVQDQRAAQAAAPVPDPVPDPAPQPGAADRVAAFDRHFENLGFAETLNTPFEHASGKLSEIEAAQLRLEADKRLMPAMIAASRAGVDEALVAQLDDIYDMYARIVQDGPQSSTLVPRADVRNSMGQAREFAGNAWETMRRDDQALIWFRKALKQFRKAGRDDEVARLEQKITRIEELLGNDADATMQRLLQPKDRTTLAEVERLLDLASLKTRQNDSFGARQDLHQAEALLAEQGHVPPAGGGLAQDLMASLSAIQSGAQDGGPTAIETSMKLRGIFQALYGQLAQNYQAADPDSADFDAEIALADDYQSKWEALNSQSDTDAFSGAMQDLLKRFGPTD